jgi:S-adenosylmethionine hydrolase
MQHNSVITLTSDFGHKDPFVGIMKGVILNINPFVNIVDITHEISPQNILEAAITIEMSFETFPYKTIHVVVVDPGVGSVRRPILVITDHYYFIGPDNGIFSQIYRLRNETLSVVHITSEHYFMPDRSATFHGRDIFAPVAAGLSLGISPYEFGEKISSLHVLPIAKPSLDPDGNVVGQVLHVDRFGNLITNVRSNNLPGKNIVIEVGGRCIQGITDYYAQKEGIMAVVGSSGYLEISLRDGSACDFLDMAVGDEIRVMPAP